MSSSDNSSEVPEQNYRIVTPYLDFWESGNDKYLEFIEKCARVCYKSEEYIKEGSAEKLLDKIVRKYEHFSVTEHFNIIVKLTNLTAMPWAIEYDIIQHNPLFGDRISIEYVLDEDQNTTVPVMYVSGNVRMWVDLFYAANNAGLNGWIRQIYTTLQNALHTHFPFFFDKITTHEPDKTMSIIDPLTKKDVFKAELIDNNVVTNNDNLSYELIKKHMTATFKFVGSRVMSHQLVRHRKFAFSQESQRYVNYDKKGFTFIVPPSVRNTYNESYGNSPYITYVESMVDIYTKYISWLKEFNIKPEDARFVLPNATKTEVVVTGTVGYWMDHVIPHRGHNEKAQWEIRKLCLEAEKILNIVLNNSTETNE